MSNTIDASKFTLKCQEVFRKAKDIATEKKHALINPSHLLSAMFIVDNSVIKSLLSKYKVDYQSILEKNEQILNTYVSKNVVLFFLILFNNWLFYTHFPDISFDFRSSNTN